MSRTFFYRSITFSSVFPQRGEKKMFFFVCSRKQFPRRDFWFCYFFIFHQLCAFLVAEIYYFCALQIAHDFYCCFNSLWRVFNIAFRRDDFSMFFPFTSIRSVRQCDPHYPHNPRIISSEKINEIEIVLNYILSTQLIK